MHIINNISNSSLSHVTWVWNRACEFRWLCPWCSQRFSLFLQRMNRCLLFERGRHWLHCCIDWWPISGIHRSDRQTIQSTFCRHCLSPSSVMDSSPCPALMHHGGFNALHAKKNTVKKGGEQKNNLFGTLENGKMNWTETRTRTQRFDIHTQKTNYC